MTSSLQSGWIQWLKGPAADFVFCEGGEASSMREDYGLSVDWEDWDFSTEEVHPVLQACACERVHRMALIGISTGGDVYTVLSQVLHVMFRG